jgi:hypothetical protein
MQGKIITMVVNRSFKNVAQFRYLEVTVTNTKLIHEEIKSRLNLGIACYHLISLIEG